MVPGTVWDVPLIYSSFACPVISFFEEVDLRVLIISYRSFNLPPSWPMDVLMDELGSCLDELLRHLWSHEKCTLSIHLYCYFEMFQDHNPINKWGLMFLRLCMVATAFQSALSWWEQANSSINWQNANSSNGPSPTMMPSDAGTLSTQINKSIVNSFF